MAVAATTELECINIMLDAIGEAPVNSLSGTLPVDVRKAQSTLTEVNKEVQSEGWSFNTEINVTLTRDASDNIVLGTDVLRVDANTFDHPSIDPIQRGLKLYDRKKNTYIFDEDLKCTVIYFRNFDEIPEQARRYINVKAARIFVDRLVGDQSLRTYTEQDPEAYDLPLHTIIGDTTFCEVKIIRKELFVKGKICVYDDWFATGDIVKFENGCYWYYGRK